MSVNNPCDQQAPTFNLRKLADFTQPPTAGGLINAVYYGRSSYGTRPPDGYTPNLEAVIALLKNLLSQERDPETRSSITGAIEYLEYLNGTVFPQLPGIIGQLIYEMINTTLKEGASV
ncbi:MAG: hypothetical protein JOY95_02255 [Silvibacterium sp.]|nr:hypothetical protein [Silvibacterium sp.]